MLWLTEVRDGRSVASDWFHELVAYLETNDYEPREADKRSLDQYFSALKAGKPQIFNVYYSMPQVMARQDPKLGQTRAFLYRLWTPIKEDASIW
jgi:hypothetical protein